MTKGVNAWIRERTGHEVESEVEVGERKICEKEVDELVHEFNMKEDLTGNRMVRFPDLLEMDQRVNGSKKGTIQPSPSLGHELRYSICK
jgi:hypothetical protein